MKKKQKLWEKVLGYFAITITVFTLIFVIYTFFNMYQGGSFSLEKTATKLVQPSEQFSHSKIIGKSKGIAFIDYNCVTRKECQGQYIIAFDRVNKTWVLNESSKNVLW